MRVIAGFARGQKLVSPSGEDTRPTLDRVKEAVFSMLLPYLFDATVLDLFSGSGALGIESLSRGAAEAVFIDNSSASVECIRANLRNTRLSDSSEVLFTDFASYLKQTDKNFDIIFLDPPYNSGLYAIALDLIAKHDLIKEEGLIVAEWDYECGFKENLQNYEIIKEKKYGRVGITLLKRRVQ